MEWLRCNKCYREMRRSKRTFSLTQCGHIYCSKCMTEVATKCRECGSQNLKTMTISYPPKLETTLNYFANLDKFMEVCVKSEEFHWNQISIALRGFEEIEEKYDDMKKSYYREMVEMKNLTQAFEKLRTETTELELIRNSLLKSMEAENARATKGVTHFSGDFQGQQSHRARGHFSTSVEEEKTPGSGLHRQYKDHRNVANFSTPDSYSVQSKLQTPKHAYNSDASFSTGGFHSEAYTLDSGVSSVPESSTDCMAYFRVPSGQRVPKSVASLKRRTPTSMRFNIPKTGFNS